MNEDGKACTVVLLDGRRLHTHIQEKLLARELLDRICAEIHLAEREYFGLIFRNEIGEEVWLQMDNPVMEQIPPQSVLRMTLSVRHYIDDVSLLHDGTTVIMFYMQVRQLISQGRLECTYDTLCRLAALVLQASRGNFTSEEIAIEQLKRTQFLPAIIYETDPALSSLRGKICSNYCQIYGWSRGDAIMRFMSIVQDIPTYGLHFFKMQNEAGRQIYVGVSLQGIGQFCYEDKEICQEFYAWKQLENLYFKDRKFTIEVKVARQNSDKNMLERREFNCYIVTQVWYGYSASNTRRLWLEAINQHQFYLSRSKTKVPLTKNPKDMIEEITHTHCNLSQGSLTSLDIDQDDNTRSSFTKSNTCPNPAISLALDGVTKTSASRKKALVAKLQNKIDQLRQLCLKEKEITGVLPEGSPYSFECLEPLKNNDLESSLSLRQLEVTNRKNDIVLLKKDIFLQRQLIESIMKLRTTSGNNNIWNQACDAFHRKSVDKLISLEESLREFEKLNINGAMTYRHEDSNIEGGIFREQQVDTSYGNNGMNGINEHYGISNHGRGGSDLALADVRSAPVAPKRFSSLSHTIKRQETEGRSRNKSLPNIFGQISEETSLLPEAPYRSPSVAYLNRKGFELDNGNHSRSHLSGSIGDLLGRQREHDNYPSNEFSERLVFSNTSSVPSQQDSYDESNISESGRSPGRDHLSVNNYGPRLPDFRKLHGTHASLV
ncbi:FERM domain-containing protein 4B [Trichoplax sp. H2]|nr:FERM domain-containing protein 4B [Trichoplax sp. H2]|eukprot:RDD44617.1 FERM domain-containing protein 4B [Trichoplax sp. H2]